MNPSKTKPTPLSAGKSGESSPQSKDSARGTLAPTQGELVRIPLSQLKPHPLAAACVRGQKDFELLIGDIKEQGGPLMPLTVVKDEDGEGYLVLFGAGRLQGLIQAGAESALCHIVDASLATPENIWRENFVRRKVSTGVRLLAYFEAFPEARDEDDIVVADRLATSRDDIAAVKALLAFGDERGADDADYGKFREKVLTGELSVRRIKQSLIGVENKDWPRPATNYATRVTSACASLANTFKNWNTDVDPEHYPKIFKTVRECVTAPKTPDALLHDLHAALGAEIQRRKTKGA